MNGDLKMTLQRQLLAVNWICYALIFSNIIYGLAVFAILQKLPPLHEPALDLGWIRPLFYGVAFVSVGASFILKNFWLKNAMSQSIPHQPPSAPERLNKLQSATIVAFAFCESSAFIGVVFTLVSRQAQDFIFLGMLSLVGMLAHWPRLEQWEEFIRMQTHAV